MNECQSLAKLNYHDNIYLNQLSLVISFKPFHLNILENTLQFTNV